MLQQEVQGTSSEDQGEAGELTERVRLLGQLPPLGGGQCHGENKHEGERLKDCRKVRKRICRV